MIGGRERNRIGPDLDKDPIAPFCFLMDASMLGVGVGFDTKGAGKIGVVAPGSAEGLQVRGSQLFSQLVGGAGR